MMWITSDERYLLVEKPVWEKMAEFRQSTDRSHEAAGILLGSRRGTHMHIVDATFPMDYNPPKNSDSKK